VMDEIELIRGLRADLPSAQAEKREAARAALLERIESTEVPVRRRSSSTWLAHRARLLAAAAGALTLAAGISVLLLGGGEAGVQSAAAKVLRQVADVAAAQPPEAPGPGQHLLTRSKVGYLELSLREGGQVAAQTRHRFMQIWHTEKRGIKLRTWWYFVSQEREMWLDSKGSGRVREISGKASFLSARQRAAWVAAGSPQLPPAGRVSTKKFDRHGLGHGLRILDFSRLSRLPTEPHRLRRWIEAHRDKIPGSVSTAGTTSTGLPPLRVGHAPVFADVGFLLGETFARPALRAALYRVASELPGVQLFGTVTDPLGRKGIGVAYTDATHGERLDLIFDPKTSTLLAERYVVTSSRRSGIAVPAGTIVGYTAHLASRVVGSASPPLVANMSHRAP
jgi:hypothetical protein